MSKQVKARDGDSLCGIAIANGFLDCTSLRADPGNSALLNRPLVKGDKVTVPDKQAKVVAKPVDKLSVFTKKNSPPVSIRFVHGSKNKAFLQDTTLTVLNVSNYETDKGGADGSAAFPSGFGFNADGDVDVDTFKVEVVDPGASGSVNAVLEALKPVKQADGSVQFQSITGVPDAALRKISSLACQQVTSGPVAFRSPYLRLVVDQQDQAGAAGQTLLTADAVDAGDETLEILDQHVRASYQFSRCPGTPKCTAVAELGIGENRQRAKVSVNILQDPANSNTPLCTIDQARKSVLKYVRQLYAQASMGVELVGNIRTVPAPSNLIAVADAKGAKAIGGGAIQIHVQVGKPGQASFDFDQTVNVVTKKGAKPIDTANALAKAINDAFAAATPPFAAKATASNNPPLVGQTIGSADVVVGDPLTQRILLSVTGGDANHPITIGSLTSSAINPDFSNNDSHVGTILERTLVKNYDTGSDHIDLFVVGSLVDPDGSGNFGEAFIPNASSASSRRPSSQMVNTALIIDTTFTTNDFVHTTIPHEMGHILMDNGHELAATEMMGAGSPVGTNERVVNGPKRISDRTMTFAGGFKGNPVKLLRTANTGVIDSKW